MPPRPSAIAAQLQLAPGSSAPLGAKRATYIFFPFPFLPFDRRLFFPTAMTASLPGERTLKGQRQVEQGGCATPERLATEATRLSCAREAAWHQDTRHVASMRDARQQNVVLRRDHA